MIDEPGAQNMVRHHTKLADDLEKRRESLVQELTELRAAFGQAHRLGLTNEAILKRIEEIEATLYGTQKSN